MLSRKNAKRVSVLVPYTDFRVIVLHHWRNLTYATWGNVSRLCMWTFFHHCILRSPHSCTRSISAVAPRKVFGVFELPFRCLGVCAGKNLKRWYISATLNKKYLSWEKVALPAYTTLFLGVHQPAVNLSHIVQRLPITGLSINSVRSITNIERCYDWIEWVAWDWCARRPASQHDHLINLMPMHSLPAHASPETWATGGMKPTPCQLATRHDLRLLNRFHLRCSRRLLCTCISMTTRENSDSRNQRPKHCLPMPDLQLGQCEESRRRPANQATRHGLSTV